MPLHDRRRVVRFTVGRVASAALSAVGTVASPLNGQVTNNPQADPFGGVIPSGIVIADGMTFARHDGWRLHRDDEQHCVGYSILDGC